MPVTTRPVTRSIRGYSAASSRRRTGRSRVPGAAGASLSSMPVGCSGVPRERHACPIVDGTAVRTPRALPRKRRTPRYAAARMDAAPACRPVVGRLLPRSRGRLQNARTSLEVGRASRRRSNARVRTAAAHDQQLAQSSPWRRGCVVKPQQQRPCDYCDRMTTSASGSHPACQAEWDAREERRLDPIGAEIMAMWSEYEQRQPPRPLFD